MSNLIRSTSSLWSSFLRASDYRAHDDTYKTPSEYDDVLTDVLWPRSQGFNATPFGASVGLWDIEAQWYNWPRADSGTRSVATFYVKIGTGNDSNDGLSWATAWKTCSHQLLSGEEVRVEESSVPRATSVNATWGLKSKNVTLDDGTVTKNIDTCESDWTSAGANVTCPASAAIYVEGSKSIAFTVKAAFGTGLAAYRAINAGAAVDFSGYQQVSFMVYSATLIAAGSLTLGLCTNADGTGEVHTIPIPVIAIGTNYVHYFVWNNGAVLNAAIKSINLKVVTDLGAIDVLFYVDNIIACLASAAQNCITHQTLISKPPLTRWLPNTVYAPGTIRRPAATAACNMYYTCTVGGTSGLIDPAWTHWVGDFVIDGGVTWQCTGFQDSWYSIRSINGTAIVLSDGASCYTTNVCKGYYPGGYYDSDTPQVLWTRECVYHDCLADTVTAYYDLPACLADDSAPAVIGGGWNSSTELQESETLISLYVGLSSGMYINSSASVVCRNLIVKNLGYYRCANAFLIAGVSSSARQQNVLIQGCSVGCANIGLYFYPLYYSGVSGCICKFITIGPNRSTGSYGYGIVFYGGVTRLKLQGIWINGCQYYNIYIFTYDQAMTLFTRWEEIRNYNGVYGIVFLDTINHEFINYISADNATAAFWSISQNNIRFRNSSINDSVLFYLATYLNIYPQDWITFQDWGQVPGTHRQLTAYGQIDTVTSPVHSGSGIAWQVACTDSNYVTALVPLIPPFDIYAKCVANVQTRVGIWVYRSNPNISCKFYLPDHVIRGVNSEVSMSVSGGVGGVWEELYFTFTPTENGLVKLKLAVWGGSGYTVTVDDFSQRDA